MSKLIECLSKSNFSESDSKKLIARSAEYKKNGLSDFDADIKAIHDYHKDLVDEMNSLKSTLKLPIQKYEPLTEPTTQPIKTQDNEKPIKSNDQVESGTKNESVNENSQNNNKPKEKRIRRGVSSARRKIRNERYLEALNGDANSIRDEVLQYFIGGGKIGYSALQQLFGGGRQMSIKGKKSIKGEALARISLLKKGGMNINELAHYLYESKPEYRDWDAADYREEIEDVLLSYNHPSPMVDEMINSREKTDEEKQLESIDTQLIKEFEMNEAYGILNQLTYDEIESLINEKESPELIDKILSEYESLTEDEVKEKPIYFQKKKSDIGEGEINYKKWKGENKEYSGVNIQDVKTGEKVMLSVYHGTTNEFYEFDSSKKGNIEGHLGKINYFTSDKGDADQNYLSGGADLTSRIEQRKERLEQQLEDDYGDIFKNKKQIAEDYGFTLNQITALGDFSSLAKAIAEKELKGKKERTLKLHIKLNNPLVLGNKSTWFETLNVSESDLDAAAQEIAEENDITIEEAKEDYDYDIKDRAIQNTGYENIAIEALQDALGQNGYDSSKASEILGDNLYDTEIDLNKLEKDLRKAELYDNEDGEIASNQVIADFFENLGFDGIILTDVSDRFKNMRIGSGASHVHVFDKYANQIKLADGTNKTFSQETKDIRFQKKKAEAKKANIAEVVKRIQKVLPKVKVVYDENLDAAGQLKGDTILINPYYADTDTPIHEAAHVLLDAMGENKVVKAAIEQLRDTDLWKETKKRYPELNDKQLSNEVLAEAIGREGANIFKTEAEKSRFMTYLNYILDWLKQKLGLDKNIAKSLAKQIIGGVGTKGLVGEKTEDSEVKQKKKYGKSFTQFRESKLGRDVERIRSDLKELKRILAEDKISDEQKETIEDIIRGIQDQFQNDKEAYDEFIKGVHNVEEIENADSLQDYTLEQLTEAWNTIRDAGDDYSKKFKDVKRKIAEHVNQIQVKKLEDNPNYKEGKKRDMTWREKWIKALADISHEFPLIQGLSNIYEQKVFEKSKEVKERKAKLEKLGKAVIKERNKKLGSISDWFTSDSAKYFEFVEEVDKKGNSKLRKDKTGLTKAQSEYLDYITELVKEKNKGLSEEAITDDLIRIDKGFQEKWRTEGAMAAVLAYLKPNTEENTNHLNYNGALTSKFNKPREKGKGYSKDFYRAGQVLIEDLAHVKYMNEVVPIVDSIQFFYENLGFDQKDGEKTGFKNTIEFLQNWKDEHLYEKKAVTDPTLDASLRFLRKLASLTTMGFNIPANVMNAAMGNYNAWRKEGLAHWRKGQVRLFGGKDRAGFGTVNKKALDIGRMFDVVELDHDSNPKMNAGSLLADIAFAGQVWGETQIQLSQFLGYLTDTEYNSFEYDKEGNLKLKDSVDGKKIDKKAFNAQMNEYKQNVHNIQGKYSSKDRRNFMRFEAGKAVAQFKLWIPDFWKERFGNEFIDRHGKTQKGSWRGITKAAIKELRDDIKKNGAKKAIWENKRIMANIKGLATIAGILILMGGDDDDEDKRRETLSLENGLSNLLFIIDPQQSKYLLSSPAAGLTKVTNAIDVVDAALHGDSNKALKNAKKLVPLNKVLDAPKQLGLE